MGREIDVNMLEQYTDDMRLYSVYSALYRVVPDFRDGFKSVQRKIIYAMYNDIKGAKTVKSSSIVGTVMDKYHPHGDTSIYGSMKPMTNWFENNIPLIDKQGNFGNFQGDNPSAMRYTEAKLAKFTIDAVIGDLKESNQVVDWEDNYSGTLKVPEYLAPNLPMLLINGSFGISVGFKVEIPKHNINEVIDATIKLIDNPNAKVVLIPDSPMECDIIDTDFASISETGFGNYKVRGRIDIGEFQGKQALFIHSLPDLVYLNTVTEKIEELMEKNILTQIHNIYENSDGDHKLECIIVLKPGADPKFVKDTIFKYTPMERSCRVNLEVVCERRIVHMGYKEYLLRFIDFRKVTKLRLYYNLLQKTMTDYHQYDAYIRVMSSGEIDTIINRIKKSTGNDEELINDMVKKFKITDLQAKTIINAPLKYLSKHNLARYIERAKNLEQMRDLYINKIRNEHELNEEIKQELKEYKLKYGKKRNTRVISQAEASDIPEGEFKVIITESNFVRKVGLNDPIKAVKGDNPKLVIKIKNTDNVILFDAGGKCYSYPVHKIPLSDKSNAGTDIRFLNKKITANVIAIYQEEAIKQIANSKQAMYIMVLTHNGFIKKMELDDFTSLTASGIFYTKLDANDFVKNIVVGGDALDVVVFSDKKALRFSAKDIPLVRRSARGVRSIGSKTVEYVDGMCLVAGKDVTDVIVVTRNGYLNKFSIAALPTSQRAKAGSSVVKLAKTDNIVNIHIVNNNDIIKLVTEKGVKEVNVSEVPVGSSISAGTKCIDGRDVVVKSLLIRNVD